MLKVWSVCVGDKYSDDYVYRLQAMVARNLLQPHEFYCLTDRAIPDVNCYLTPVDWLGWWQKLHLFEAAVTGQNLYLDLDVVVTGNLDRLLSRELSMPANWAQSGHGGCQSSVMSWSGDYSYITRAFNPGLLDGYRAGNFGFYGPKKLWGDQEFITDLLGDPGKGIVKPMPHVFSYKYHCRDRLPADASVVCFHGNPKPADVSDRWVIDARHYSRVAQ